MLSLNSARYIQPSLETNSEGELTQMLCSLARAVAWTAMGHRVS